MFLCICQYKYFILFLKNSCIGLRVALLGKYVLNKLSWPTSFTRSWEINRLCQFYVNKKTVKNFISQVRGKEVIKFRPPPRRGKSPPNGRGMRQKSPPLFINPPEIVYLRGYTWVEFLQSLAIPWGRIDVVDRILRFPLSRLK